MLTVPEWYRDAINSTSRKVELYIDFGAFTDPSSETDSTFTGDMMPFSSPLQLFDGNDIDDINFAVYEADGVDTSADNGLLMPPKTSVSTPQVGIWSGPISDANRMIDWTLDIGFSDVHHSSITLRFGFVHFVDFDIVYYVDEVETWRDVVRGNNNKMWMPDPPRPGVDYDRMEIRVIKISEPYRHARLLELSFGAMVRISTAQLVDQSNLIYTKDPLAISSPPNQLEVSLSNIHGDFDIDNPDSLFAYLHERNKVVCSFLVANQKGDSFIVPMGTFFVMSSEGDTNTVRVTAQDCRYMLLESFKPILFNTSQSIFEQLATILGERGVPYIIDLDLQTKFLTEPVLIEDRFSALSAVLFCAQFYLKEVYVDREGYLHIEGPPDDNYGLIGKDALMNWPALRKENQFNMLRIVYGNESTDIYVIDLRSEIDQIASFPLGIDNPFIRSYGDAVRVANWMIPRMMMINAKVIETFGDPAMDLWDSVKAQTRFTSDIAKLPEMRVTEIEINYTGVIRSNVKGVY